MYKCLITGGSGFVGQNLIPHLKNEGFKIKVLSRSELNFVKEEDANGYQAIVHLAGKAHDLKNTSTPKEYYQVNLELTKKLYDAFLRSDSKIFIFLSSVKAVADEVEGILSESVVPNPITHYGKSKLLAEEYITSQPLPADKKYFILRPCMIHGPGNKGNLNLLYKIVKKGIPYPLAAFDNRRSFLSVHNLCFIIEKLLSTENIPSGAYNVSDNDTLSTKEVVTILSVALNKSPRLWNIPVSVMHTIAKIGDMFHLPLNSERLGKLTESYIVDNSKIKSALNTELPIDIKKGLELTALSFVNK